MSKLMHANSSVTKKKESRRKASAKPIIVVKKSNPTVKLQKLAKERLREMKEEDDATPAESKVNESEPMLPPEGGKGIWTQEPGRYVYEDLSKAIAVRGKMLVPAKTQRVDATDKQIEDRIRQKMREERDGDDDFPSSGYVVRVLHRSG